jgi:signal transduction histidine kinase
MNADLIAAQLARQEFMGMLTHDMRTPLTNVNILLGMISEGVYDDDAPKRRKLTAKMVPEIERISRLIEDLLSLEKLDEGKLSFVREPCLVEQLLETVSDAVQNQARASDKAVAIDISEDFTILADSYQITRVLINLTANALKYTANNTTVTLKAQRIESQALFEVIDEGPGVKAETIPRLFERFGQGEDSLARTGFGLGLAICKAIVEAHNGNIGARNREDRKGAIFFFTLPMA